MTNKKGIATAVLALAIALSSVGGDHRASTAEIRPRDGAGSGIAPKNIIFDDDYALYADGMAAHYILLELERAGYARVLAMVADSSNTYSAPAMAAVNKAFGRADIPVGAYQGGVSSARSNSAWSQQIAVRFGTPGDVRSNYPDAVATLRSALAAAANGSVTYVSTGFLTNLAALLQSSSDAFSPLTGAQLVTAKVVEIVVMGGDYPTGSGEFNFAGDPAAAAFVFANSPVAITGTGASLGASIMVRPPSAPNGATDPFSYALSLEGAAGTGGYDPLTVHYAVMGLRDDYIVAGAGGINTVNSSNGDNSWSTTGGKASYLGKLSGDGQLANAYDAMVARATLK
jgi:Inosine-uridine preferring nucleoside hydrolase